MCGFLSSLVLKIIIGILNILIFLYGAGIIPLMVILTSVGNSDVSEELKLGTPTLLGIVIGCFAIAAAILFYVTSCLVCLPDIIIRILVLMYCGLTVFKIVIEIVFLMNISMVQNSMNETLEKYLINAILRAGGQEELAEKDMTYKEFQALPNVNKSNYACSSYCKLQMELIDEIQSRMECCGIESPNDWNKVPIGIPGSCCTSSDCKEMRNDGCMGKVEDIIEKVVTILLYVVIAAIVVQVVTLIFIIGFAAIQIYVLDFIPIEDEYIPSKKFLLLTVISTGIVALLLGVLAIYDENRSCIYLLIATIGIALCMELSFANLEHRLRLYKK